MRVLLPVLGVGLVIFAAAILYFFKQGLDAYLYGKSLQSVSITAPAGWDVQPYDTLHGELITGATFDPAPAAGTTTNDILFAFEGARLGGKEGIALTFSRGEEKIALRIQIMPFVPRKTSFAERLGYGAPAPAEPPVREVFGSLDALPILIGPRVSMTEGDTVPVPVNYRYLTAQLGDPEAAATAEIALLTNSSDAALAALLGEFDLAALNDRMPTRDATILSGLGFVPRDTGALSDLPPRPTPAYRALTMLQDGRSLDSVNEELLTRIAALEIIDMSDLLRAYPSLDAIRPDVLQLFEEESQENAARSYARILANSGRAWNNHEYYVLSEIGRPGTSQESLADYLASGHDIAPEVLALVARLPETGRPAPEVVSEGQPVVRTGLGAQNCTLQNGVRRCVVGNN
jgi:hypothetical protein